MENSNSTRGPSLTTVEPNGGKRKEGKSTKVDKKQIASGNQKHALSKSIYI